MVSIVVILLLLGLPAMAVQRSGVDYRWVIAYGILISAFTYWVYARDKRRAEQGKWRVPEVRLQLLDLLGGWPGGFLAQRRLRHKCSKVSYQVVFWLIVLGWQLAALDSLRNWQYSRAAMRWLLRTT